MAQAVLDIFLLLPPPLYSDGCPEHNIFISEQLGIHKTYFRSFVSFFYGNISARRSDRRRAS